jgi:hypothetical protein
LLWLISSQSLLKKEIFLIASNIHSCYYLNKEALYKNLPISFSSHSFDSMRKRGTDRFEVETTIKRGSWKQAKLGRFEAENEFVYGKIWNNKNYDFKKINPVFIVENNTIIVITVYVFYYNY